MENLSDTYHDPSYRFPKIIIGRLTPPLKKKIGGGVITIRQPTLLHFVGVRLCLESFRYISIYFLLFRQPNEGGGGFSNRAASLAPGGRKQGKPTHSKANVAASLWTRHRFYNLAGSIAHTFALFHQLVKKVRQPRLANALLHWPPDLHPKPTHGMKFWKQTTFILFAPPFVGQNHHCIIHSCNQSIVMFRQNGYKGLHPLVFPNPSMTWQLRRCQDGAAERSAWLRPSPERQLSLPLSSAILLKPSHPTKDIPHGDLGRHTRRKLWGASSLHLQVPCPNT